MANPEDNSAVNNPVKPSQVPNPLNMQSEAPGGPLGGSSGLNSRPLRFWLAFGALLLVLVAVLTSIGYLAKQKKTPSAGEQKAPAAQGKEGSPVALPAIKNDAGADELKTYFTSISPSFKDEFMSQVPEVTKEAYKKYKEIADPDQKLEAARAFYIYLNNPGPKSKDPLFEEFLQDVKSDLETALGTTLF